MTHAKRTSDAGSRKRVVSTRKKIVSSQKRVVKPRKSNKSSKHYKTVIDAYKKFEMQGMTRHEKALYLNGYTKEQTKLSDYDLLMIEMRKKNRGGKEMARFDFQEKAVVYEILVYILAALIIIIGLLILAAIIKGAWWILWTL